MAATREKESETLESISRPEKCVYTKCYCEENIWHLCKSVQQSSPSHLANCYAVFISNAKKAIPIWHQKCSERPDKLVIWDYHVIFLHQRPQGGLVYDLDTALPFPCAFDQYVSQAIGSDQEIKEEFHRYFRVVPAALYLATFASDRSHMLNKDKEWMSPPPQYPCIKTQESTNNLAEFISMERGTGVGQVLTCDHFTHTFLDT